MKMNFKNIIYWSILLPIVVAAQPRLPEGYFWKKLPNGLEVVVIENNKVPLATIEIAVKNGAYTEGPEYSGLSHLFEHMFFKANQTYSNQEKFLKRTQELGAIWNGTTSEERVNYFFTFDKDSLKQGLQFMNAAIRFPLFRIEDMKKERLVVDGEFQRNESDPNFQITFECQKRLWGDLLTRKNPIGDHNIINTATPEKMTTIKNKYYVPNNSLVVVCGDVEHNNAFQLVESIFGSWEHSGFDPQTKFPIPEFAPLTKTDYFVKESPIAQTPYLTYWWQGPDTRNDSVSALAADVFNTILGLNSSKWQQALVNTGLSSYAYVGYQTSKYVGPVSIYAMPNPNKLKECTDEIKKQISQWQNDDYFTDEQLNDAKQSLRRNNLRSLEKPSELSHNLTYWWCSGSYEFNTDYIKNCMAITRSDIKRYLNSFITNKPYVAGILISPETNKSLKTESFFKP